jgi:GNAT superfamily N-acetyltransferase
MAISIEISIITASQNHNAAGLSDDLKWWCFGGSGVGAFVQAHHDGVRIGYATMVEKPPFSGQGTFRVAEIGHNYVENAFRRRGVFSKLVDEIEKYARNEGISALYVTPNSESEPIYRKLEYTFCGESAELVLIPFDNPVADGTEKALTEIQREEYINLTLDCTRLVKGCTKYLQWRFAKPSAEYRFFCTQDMSAIMAVRPGSPGPLGVYVLSELFLCGQKPPLEITLEYAKQLRCRLTEQKPIILPSTDRCKLKDSTAVRVYRNFPMACKTLAEGFSFPSTHQYQFTDSDYG